MKLMKLDKYTDDNMEIMHVIFFHRIKIVVAMVMEVGKYGLNSRILLQ